MSLIRSNPAFDSIAGQFARHVAHARRGIGHISSGRRVQRPAEDAAGLGIATNLETAQRSTGTAQLNTDFGMGLIVVAESASDQVTDVLQRMRELAVQSASDTFRDQDRQPLETEYSALLGEIDRIASHLQYSGIRLGDGSVSTLEVQVGIHENSDNQVSIKLGSLTSGSLGVAGSSVATTADALAALDPIDTALDSTNRIRSRLGAVYSRLESAYNSGQVHREALTAATQRIIDADMAYETSELTKRQILMDAAASSMAQAKNMGVQMVNLIA